MKSASQVINVGLMNAVLTDNLGHLLVTDPDQIVKLEVYAAGPKLVLTVYGLGNLSVATTKALTKAEDKRWECGGITIKRVDDSTFEISNTLDPSCSAQIKLNGNTTEIETMDAHVSFTDFPAKIYIL